MTGARVDKVGVEDGFGEGATDGCDDKVGAGKGSVDGAVEVLGASDTVGLELGAVDRVGAGDALGAIEMDGVEEGAAG
eukprot:CAMPEP_0202499232 /NCGR_PEP_ID=MMETSP1361-20130828/29050_1 /ASSEMBLY_ACC=CAM_ASM_000849 /TAXON_ID=210615 /ORGANISM="Staurosira complex sp., Strain CCMP2646" /LENGTH=77 /DNA_ID=CAMNT_0049131361 /DNA_START=132 /DNA_END=365 /DNA_ORIENTATION=-